MNQGDVVEYISHDTRVYKYTIYKVLEDGDKLEIRRNGLRFYLIKSESSNDWLKTKEIKCVC